MIITGVTPDEFRQAVAKAGIAYGDNLRAEVGREYSATRFNARVVLKTTGYRMGLPTSELAPGQRRSASAFSARRINAVCWHGYRDALIELFNINPNAKVRTAMAKYLGRESFYREYPKTGYQNIGAPIAPVTMPELCDCSE